MATKKKQKPRQLTEKQSAFAFEYITNGRNASEAYREVYDVSKTIKPETVWRSAHKVLYNAKVSARVGELQQEQYHSDVMGVEERKLMLTTLARLGDIKSIDLLNKMESVYVEKIDLTAEVTVKSLESFYETKS